METWKDILGYEGSYQVSDQGRVRSLTRKRKNRYGEIIKEGVLLKERKDRNGYLHVILQNNGEKKFALIHRLVAEAFIPHVADKTEVNHIDENKENNRVCNLEWCDRDYNMNYGSRPNARSTPVIQLTKHGDFVAEYASACEASRKTGVLKGGISNCCLGKAKSAGGYVWRHR